jgi:predicted phage baseplate assembly protein
VIVGGDQLALPPGRRLVLEGVGPDGLHALEPNALCEPLKLSRNTLLRLARPLAQAYRRRDLVLHANVARATHGESVREVLGSGAPAEANQRFRLARLPVTHTAGRQAALTIRIDGVAWRQVRALTGAAPEARLFALSRDAEGRSQVVFGDGAEGARSSAGRDNILATYRSGLGPEGAVKAEALALLVDRPLAVRAVRNPLPALGAEAPEPPEATRLAAPQGLRALDRVVSLADVAAFAEGFGSIAKARAEEVWAGPRRLVALTVAAADGSSPAAGSDLLVALAEGLRSAADPSLTVRILGYQAVPVFVTARIRAAAERDPPVVLAAAQAALDAALGFAARGLAVPLAAARLLAVLAAVPGVAEAVLTRLDLEEAPVAPPPPAALLPALGARFNGATMDPAQLLLPVTAKVELA